MTLPVLQVIGIGVFTVCAIIAIGLVMMDEEPMFYHFKEHSNDHVDKESIDDLKKDRDLIQLMEMGFKRAEAESALRMNSYNLQNAIVWLLQRQQPTTNSKEMDSSDDIPPSNDESQVLLKTEQNRLSLLEEYERSLALLEDANDKFERQAKYLQELNDQKIRLELALQESATTANSTSESHLELESANSVPSMGTSINESNVNVLAEPMIPLLEEESEEKSTAPLSGTEFESVIEQLDGTEGQSQSALSMESIVEKENAAPAVPVVDNTLALVGTEFEDVFNQGKSELVQDLLNFQNSMAQADPEAIVDHLAQSGIQSFPSAAEPESELDLYTVPLTSPLPTEESARSTHSSEWDIVSNV